MIIMQNASVVLTAALGSLASNAGVVLCHRPWARSIGLATIGNAMPDQSSLSVQIIISWCLLKAFCASMCGCSRSSRALAVQCGSVYWLRGGWECRC